MKKYRYMVKADITEWIGKDIIEKWKAEEVMVAENEWDAMNMFTDGIYENYGTAEKEIEVDDIRAKKLGPADVFLKAEVDAYVTGILDTITVGDLIELLKEFDEDSKIYLVDYFKPQPIYGAIATDSLEYKN